MIFACFCWGAGASKGEGGGKDDFLQMVEFSFDYVVFVWLSSGMEQCSNIGVMSIILQRSSCFWRET